MVSFIDIHRHHTQVIKVTGSLDISTRDELQQVINKLREGSPSHVILNLSQLDFIDSSGVGIIMEFIYLSQQLDFHLEIDGVNEQIDQWFRIMGVYKVLNSIRREDR